MGNRPRTRKRVHALLSRAPDGSAFQACGNCGASVAIALADMHECENHMSNNVVSVKRFKGIDKSVAFNIPHSFNDQPRSPFRFFMEEFVKSYEDVELIVLDRKGVETWKTMSKEEREPYVKKAEMVNSAYARSLLREVEDMSWVDDEADSAMVGKFDQTYEDYRYCNDYDSSDGSGHVGFESFNTWEWEMVKSWVLDSST